jgi:thiol-disulfide isomerase/thioredoxin
MNKVVYVFKKYDCPPCKNLLPFIEKISSHYMTNVPPQNRVVTKIIETSEGSGMATAAAYGVNATPTILFLLNGEVVGRVDGGNKDLIEDYYYNRLAKV